MFAFLLGAFSCVCVLHHGLSAEECTQRVLARRDTLSVPAGDTVSLSCVIHHCEGPWRGNWTWEKSADSMSSVVEESSRHRFATVKLTASETKLTLNILNANTSDEGSYRCSVNWVGGGIEMGHWTKVNITEASSHRRSDLHRVLVCCGALLCLPIILGLARCLSPKAQKSGLPYSRIRVTYAVPQPPPRRPIPQKRKTVPPKDSSSCEQKAELVYADISQDAPLQQGATRDPGQSTIYSDVRFS
ncbi:uncharacterized protein si:dkey-52l18.4 [Cololabis saira]|uniref:uncharacterized protein si:dkey-52l18.4 n=1 Tax=Cololabis saira TaxID=129043 RepID=UPI002AD37F85|nr:uncharacterized protein si:dkey-52l18.4 [Cololabis saira]